MGEDFCRAKFVVVVVQSKGVKAEIAFGELFDISPANFQVKVKELKQHFDNGKMDVVFLQDK